MKIPFLQSGLAVGIPNERCSLARLTFLQEHDPGAATVGSLREKPAGCCQRLRDEVAPLCAA